MTVPRHNPFDNISDKLSPYSDNLFASGFIQYCPERINGMGRNRLTIGKRVLDIRQVLIELGLSYEKYLEMEKAACEKGKQSSALPGRNLRKAL